MGRKEGVVGSEGALIRSTDDTTVIPTKRPNLVL